ncbi:MAG: hypothetical protein KBH11_02940 [Bacteroidia bacterium]|nr:hypothetical protein [Bacteroidota bacterium]MBP9082001.1 hypothetical protein [Bacteroidia bacterium]
MKWHESLKYNLWLLWQGLSLLKVSRSIFSVFGVLWLIVEVLAFFNKQEFADGLKSIWWLFLLTGIILIIYQNWPKHLFSFKVNNRDVSISIQIGDIFKNNGALIVPVNNRLDVDNNGTTAKSSSILKFFIAKIYKSVHTHLATDIEQKLQDSKDWYSNFKIRGNPNEYKIGTVVPIFREEKQFYLLCNATLNEQFRSKCSPDDLRNSLIELWAFLTHCGSKDNLIIPIIGTGRGRITLTREEVIKEIVLSFLASLSSENFCEQLTICIHPYDLKKYNMNISNITDFVRLHCLNANFSNINDKLDGQAIG